MILIKIDKEKLSALAALPDDELWAQIQAIAKKYGFKLPEKAPSHSEMEKIRSLATDGAKPNMNEALKLINEYRKGKRNG